MNSNYFLSFVFTCFGFLDFAGLLQRQSMMLFWIKLLSPK
jgi:hypothetical protein